jgi:hypothetical protein
MAKKQPSNFPNIDALLECGARLAGSYDLPVPPEDKLRGKINEILFGPRRYWDSWEKGLVTKAELRYVLLAHMATFVATSAGVPPPQYREDLALEQAIDSALFG